MAKATPAPARGGSSTNAVLYAAIGLLAMGNVVFLLLWLLQPLTGGTSGPRGGRRIEVRGASRALTVAEGLDPEAPALGIESRMSNERFEELGKQLVQLAQSKRGAEQAEEFFGSEAGREATPAVTITFPRRTGSEALEIYVLDARRQLCYCRAGEEREPVAIKAESYERIAAQLAELSQGSAGSFAIPYYVPIGESLTAKLARLEGQLQVTTISSNPHQLLLDIGSAATAATGLQFSRPDTVTLTATVSLPPYIAMARGLAEAMDRASEKVVARHLDFLDNREAVVEIARSLRRAVTDVEDSLVLQYGDRIRVIRSDELVERDEAGPLMPPSAPRFAGESVVEKALGGLLAERGLLYFAEGHGERRSVDSSAIGIRLAAEQLNARGFRSASLNLAEQKAIPADCDALVIAGPTKAYEPELEAAIDKHARKGGHLALMLHPPQGPVVLADLLKRYGISVPAPQQIIRTRGRFADPTVAELQLNAKLDFVRKWTREPTVLVTACELVVTPPAADAPFEVFRVARPMEAGASSESPCLIAAVRPKGEAKGPKLLVFGDVDAFTNQIVRQLPANAQLLADALAWLAE